MQRLVDLLATTEHRVIVSKGPLADQITLHDNQTGEGFLPQPAILPQVDLVITHGGNNTVTEAFHHGKPMIVLPLFWDQVDNAQRVDETGFGRRLSTYGFRDEELTDAIDELLADRGAGRAPGRDVEAHQGHLGHGPCRRPHRARGRFARAHRLNGHRNAPRGGTKYRFGHRMTTLSTPTPSRPGGTPVTDTLERVKTYQQFIGGEFVDAADGRTAEVVNPANDEVIANVPASSVEDVNRAVEAAATAFETWKNTTPQDRSLLLLKLADILESKADEIGRLESANAGKPVGAAIDEMTTSVDLFRFFAGAARVMDGLAANEFLAGHTSIIRRDPIGVVASIAPWNYPLYMASWKLGPALATGNTVVLKPSARTPLSALRFAEILAEVFPPGVVNVLSGSGADIGDALVGHPTVRMVSITGDTVTGKRVAKIAADTSSGSTSSSVARPRSSSSTTPTSTSRPRRSAPRATGTPARTARRRPGSSPGPRSTTSSSRHWPTRSRPSSGATRPRATTSRWARSSPGPRRTRSRAWSTAPGVAPRSWSVASARIVPAPTTSRRSSPVPDQGSEIVQDEVFGPVVTVQRFSDEEQAVKWANDVPFGLASSLFTSDIGRAMRVAKALEFGHVWINEHFTLASETPHGGVKQSGYGKDGSKYALEDYTFIKHVMINTGT